MARKIIACDGWNKEYLLQTHSHKANALTRPRALHKRFTRRATRENKKKKTDASDGLRIPSVCYEHDPRTGSKLHLLDYLITEKPKR